MRQIRREFLTRPLFYLFIIVFVLTLSVCRYLPTGGQEKTGFEGVIEGEVYKAAWNKSEDLVFRGEVSGKPVKILLGGAELGNEYREKILKGGFVSLCGEIEIPSEARNFGEFDYKNYLRSRGVEYICRVSEEDILAREKKKGELHSPDFYGSAIRADIHNCLLENLGEEYSAWVMSVMTGDTGYLESEEKSGLAYAGFSHLVAVSGAHIAFFVLPFEWLLKKFTMLGLAEKKMFLIAPMVFLWFVAGGSPSITRAVVMAVFAAVAMILRKPCDKANSLGLAGLMQIAFNPFSVFNTGFLLSYSAVVSMIFILPAIKKYIKINNKMVDSLVAGAAVNLGVLPLLLYLFNGFSVFGAVANTVVAYAANFLCVGGYVVYAADRLYLPDIVVNILSKGILGASEVFRSITEKISSGDTVLSRFETVSPSFCMVVIYYCVVVLLVAGKKSYCFVGGAVVLVLLVSGMNRCARAEFVFFDVGQGSAALVKTCDGVCGVIDTGDGSVKLSEVLLKEGVDKLDFVVISHGHNDHYGGFDELAENVEIGRIFLPSNEFDTYCNSLGEKYQDNGTEIVKIVNNASFRMGKYSVLNLYESGVDEENLNNGSVLVEIKGDWGCAVLPGDTENKLLDRYAEKGIAENADILCLPHHGGASSGSEKFLFSASPEYVIISCGKGNSYGHPSESVLESVSEAGVAGENIFRTDEGGAVRLKAVKYPFITKEFVFVWQKKMKLSQVFRT